MTNNEFFYYKRSPYFKLATILATVMMLMLLGCDGGKDGGEDGGDGNSEYNVTVVDGYIKKATVKDANDNSAFDNGDGTYSFVKTPAYPISSTGGETIETGDAFIGDLIVGSADADMYATSGNVISPVTTLLTTITENKATSTLDSGLSVKLAELLGITEADLLTDFISSGNLELAKTAQVLHIMQQSPELRVCFSTELPKQSIPNFAGMKSTATNCLESVNLNGDLSDIKQTIYKQIIDDVDNYTGTSADLEAGIDTNKSMLENMKSIENQGGLVGGDITSLQTAMALVETAGSGDAAKTITAAQLIAFSVDITITNNDDLVALMVDVIRQSTNTKLDTVAELKTLEPHIINFSLIDTQSNIGDVTNEQLLEAYRVILDDQSIKEYKQIDLAALTNSDATAVTTVEAIQSRYDLIDDIAAPILTVTPATLNENSGIGQVIANATATFASGSELGAFSLESSGDGNSLTIDPESGVITVNADPDYEDKSMYAFTVKVTSLLTEDNSLEVGEDTIITNGTITNIADVGIARVVYSYGAEDDNAHAIGNTNEQTDNPSDNQLIITFNTSIDENRLAPENFHINGTALANDSSASYTPLTKTYAITIGATNINVVSGSESIISVINVTTIEGLLLDTGYDTAKVEARTGITHNNFTYNTVKSPDTAEYWLDRDLGATNVATTATTNNDSLGDLYQWGRPADGHEGRTPTNTATTTRATSITPTDDKFITNLDAPYDWTENDQQDTKDVDDNGALRSAFFSKIDGSGICPTGFRVPTKTEIGADTIGAITTKITNCDTAFSSFLKLPSAGMRDHEYGIIKVVDQAGYYWTSSASGTSTNILRFYVSNPVSLSPYYRSRGFSVRCIKD